MKRIIIVSGVLFAASAALLALQAPSPCIDWRNEAEAARAKGHHAVVLQKITPYFAKSECAGREDIEALRWALDARIAVPQSDFGHIPGIERLAEMLAVKGDASGRIRMARIALREGDTDKAITLLDDINTPEARLMRASLTGKLEWQSEAEPEGRFFKAVAQQFNATPAKGAVDLRFDRVARTLIKGERSPTLREDLALVSRNLSIEDATLLSGLLLRIGKLKEAALSLQRVRLPLNDLLLNRLSLSLFRLGWHDQLGRENLGGRARQEWPEKTLAVAALAGLITKGEAGIYYNKDVAIARIGREAASAWHGLFNALERAPLNPKETLDALANIAPFMPGFGPFSRLEADILFLFGETEMAERAAGFAKVLGFEMPLAIAINTPARFQRLQETLFGKGAASPQDIATIKALSPKALPFWRIVAAREKLRLGTKDATGEALFLLREVLSTDPGNGAAHSMMAAGLVRFGDWPRAFTHASRAVEIAPEEAPRILRQVLGFYKEAKAMPAKALVHAWVSLTRQEAGARKVPDTKLLHDRLMLLAAYAEQKADKALAREAYQRTLDHFPSHAIAFNNLAMLELAAGDLVYARDLARKAVGIAPDTPAFQDTLAQIENAVEKQQTES